MSSVLERRRARGESFSKGAAGGAFSTSLGIESAVERDPLLLRRPLRLLFVFLREALRATSGPWSATGCFLSASATSRPSFNLAAFPPRRPKNHSDMWARPGAGRAGRGDGSGHRRRARGESAMRRRVVEWWNAICTGCGTWWLLGGVRCELESTADCGLWMARRSWEGVREDARRAEGGGE
jgi:hypothetical protein